MRKLYWLDRCIDNGLHLITIRVNDECGEIVLTVVSSQAGRTIVFAAMPERFDVKVSHGFAARCRKCYVEAGIGRHTLR